jgi:gamma-glutamylcyclotransferase (GGCT)/AIG2-like uncharacterized protein YtfP
MLLAVYGTFRKGERLSHYLEDLREQGTTEVVELTGLKLFVVGWAPGAKITGVPNDKAVVELIEADIPADEATELMSILDIAEGVKYNLYERNLIDTPKGQALIYTKCGDVDGCIEITDWMEWQKKTKKEKYRAIRKAGDRAIYV